MALAYKSIFYPMNRLPTPEETKLVDMLLFEKLQRSPKDKKEEIRSMLISGQLCNYFILFVCLFVCLFVVVEMITHQQFLFYEEY
jgi:hypothetical protein